MIIFFNKGLILEQEIVKCLNSYFADTDIPEYYKNFTINVTNEHPFARLLLSESPESSASSIFPAIIIATEEDVKPDELTNLSDTHLFVISQEDIANIEEYYNMMTSRITDKLYAAMETREDKRLFGMTYFIRRRDKISVEIWSENAQLKNELYEHIRLYLCGFLRDYLDSRFKGLAIFDNSIKGERSNNFNVDFGIELYGARITFDADYIIEQSFIDTDLIDENIDFMEVINHVKGEQGTSTSGIF